MRVLKFGGTSLGSPERMQRVAQIAMTKGECIIVLSAMSKTTNTLIEISEALSKRKCKQAQTLIVQLREQYNNHIGELFEGNELYYKLCSQEIWKYFDRLDYLLQNYEEGISDKEIIVMGERFSTIMFYNLCASLSLDCVLLDSMNFMRTNLFDEPDREYIKQGVSLALQNIGKHNIYIAQGFMCRDSDDRISNLGRGGSDYTASLVAWAIDADEIEIWTDIDGIHSCDPRVAEGTHSVEELLFEEAAELAYFGAKILHPTCIQPAKDKNIPVRLLNTFAPECKGTLISNHSTNKQIKSVAAKDGITCIKIKSSRMLLAYGFLSRLFEVFERYETPIDMICTSEVGVSLTIDDTHNLEKILRELSVLGEITVDKNMCIVCVVGSMDWNGTDFQSQILSALSGIPIRLISYGGSNYNLSLLIEANNKNTALQQLNKSLF